MASLAAAALLSACGGGGDGTSGSPTTPPAGLVAISGAVVKGPVAGATVCAFALAAGAKGAALGPCVLSAGNGNYTLSVAAGADILLEATGGSYRDEVTQATAGMPADRPMTSIVPGDAGAVTAYLTPLTTLATNAARAGGLSLPAFRREAVALAGAFRLGTLDISADRPDVTGSYDTHGRALVAISQLVANGLALRDVLGTNSPAALAAAFRQAYAAVGSAEPTEPTEPTTPTDPDDPGAAPVASGSVTVAGGPVTAFAPDAAGFIVSLDKADTTYRFEKQVSFPVGTGGQTATGTAYLAVTRRSAGEGGPLATTIVTASLAPQLGLGGLKARSCAGDCGITVSTPAGATHPVTLTFNRFDLGGWTLDGSLTGEAQGAAYVFADLPRTTTGSVRVNGVASVATTGDVVRSEAPGGSSRQVTLRLRNGGMVTVAERLDAAGVAVGTRSAGYLAPGATANLCVDAGANGCAYAVTETATSLTVTFNGTRLDGGVVLDGAVTLRKTGGTLTSPTLGSFAPVSDGISAANDSRTLTFSVLGTQAQGGISLVSVKHRARQVTEVSVTTGIGAGVYQCFREAAPIIGVPACQGVTVSADGLSVTFAAAPVGGGFGANRQSATLQGTLTARAF